MIGGPEEIMPQRKVAEICNATVRTIKRWQEESGFPKPFYIGRMAYYRAIEVRLWQEKQFAKNKPPKPET